MDNIMYYLTFISNVLIIVMDFFIILFGLRIILKQKKMKEDLDNIKKEVDIWIKKKS